MAEKNWDHSLQLWKWMESPHIIQTIEVWFFNQRKLYIVGRNVWSSPRDIYQPWADDNE